jgi:hypothetical protein
MANYCSNSVLFLGDPNTVAEIRQVFAQIESEQQRTNRYHLPDFVSGDKGHMLDITFNEDWINYETRWQPNLDLLVQVADLYQAVFISRFDEMSNGIYGEAIYQNNELKTIYRLAWAEEDLADDAELTAMREEQRFLIEKHGGPGYER